MQRLFGSKQRDSRATQSDEAVFAQIANSKELCEKREAHLNHQLKKEIVDAIEHKQAGRKSRALSCLKRKKSIVEELEGLAQKQLQIQMQEHALIVNQAQLWMRWSNTDELEQDREITVETREDASHELLSIASQPVAISGGADDELRAERAQMEEQKVEQSVLNSELPSEGSSSQAFPRAPDSRVSALNELVELDQLAVSMHLRVDPPMPMPIMGTQMVCVT
mmetsp:Transcript_37601/g.87924  ORF Transcript_37601/g.87924 Transcript_37601/m.87924 type:complete len:223 (-) Transcript_37601:164-832(-)